MSKKVLAIILAAVAVISSMGLSACNGEGKHKHKLVHKQAVESTCTSEGNKEHWHCSGCGMNFSDEEAQNETDDTVIAPLPHNYVDLKCSVCGVQKLNYILNNDETSYTAYDVHLTEVSDLVIPAYENGLPVTRVVAGTTWEENNTVTNVSIPDTITSVKTIAFELCTNLQYTVYDNAKYLGNATNPYLVLMFATSKDITSCSINDRTKVIADGAFYNCVNLKSLIIPEGVVYIDDGAFSCCKGLTGITIPDSVVSIGDSAFYGCAGLTGITIPDSVVSIGVGAFNRCTELTDLKIGKGLNSIGWNAFVECDKLRFNEYDNAKYLANGNNQFYYLVEASSDNILSCEINADTRIICERAFWLANHMDEITLPTSIISIGSEAFECKRITFLGTKEQWKAIKKERLWNGIRYSEFTVICTDGKLDKDGNVITE